MSSFYYNVLKTFFKKPRSTKYLKKKFKKIRPDRLEDALDFLEDNLLIEEATVSELDAIKNGLPLKDDSSVLSGTYFITEEGIQVIEEQKEERKRFYLPFVITTVISIVSLIVSIVSLAFSFNN